MTGQFLSVLCWLFFVFERPFVKRFALCYRTVVLSVLSCLSVTFVYCGQTVGWIKMKLGTEVGLGLGHIVLDADPAPPPKGHSPQFSAHVCCGQTAGWIEMPLGTEVGLGPGDIMLDGTQLPLKKGAQLPNFPPMSIVAKRLGGSRCHYWYDVKPRPKPHCVRWGPSSPPPKKKGDTAPNFRQMFIVAKWSPISATAELLFVVVEGWCIVGVVNCVCLCCCCFRKRLYWLRKDWQWKNSSICTSHSTETV